MLTKLLLVSSCVFCLASNVSGQVTRQIEMPNKTSIGQMREVSAQRIRRVGFSDYLRLRDAAMAEGPLTARRFPLVGSFLVPADSQFAVTVADGGPLSIDSKLLCLKAIDTKKIASISFLGSPDKAGFRVIADMSGLVALSATADSAWGSPDGTAALANLKSLRWIQFGLPLGDKHCSGKPIIDAILELDELVSLELPSSGFSEFELVQLTKHPKLECIWLPSFSGNLGDDAVRRFLAMPTLRELLVACDATVTNEAVMTAVSATNLDRLVICTEAEITCQRQLRKVRPACNFQLRGFDE